MQDQVGDADGLAQVGALEERGGVLGGLLGVDLPADDLAAVDVQDEVEVEEGPAQVGGQIGDVPGPDLVGAGGLPRLGAGLGGPSGVRGSVDPRRAGGDRRWIRGELAALVGQRGDDLVGLELAKRGALADLQNEVAPSGERRFGGS